MPAVAASDRATNENSAVFTVTRDTAPPDVWLDVPRRVYSGATSIPVTWGATDDASGVARYDVQVQVENGEWTGWLTGTLDTKATYVLEEGQWFSFRVTATDNVGNQASAETSSHVARVTKYYYLGGRRVAMQAGGVVYYLHGDHLGSTSLTTDASGGVVARQLYHPYGTVRHSAGTLPTDFGFTGQRHDGSTGLVFMHARYYHAGLGRFVSADTIVPNPISPQLFNRYSYAGNNPALYNDPDGHGGPLIGIIALALVVWVSMEMLVGEDAPPHDPQAMYLNGAKTALKWGGDTIGDAYALADEWPENRLSNAGALTLPWVSAGMMRAGARSLKYVDEAAEAAKYADEAYEIARRANYRGTFFANNPALREFSGEIVVHHNVPLEVLKKHPGLFSVGELNAASNLRGIPTEVNNSLHLSTIHGKLWQGFWKRYPKTTRQQVLDFAKWIDAQHNLKDLVYETFQAVE